MPLIARCTATLVGDEIVLTMLNGIEHSRIPVHEDMDAAEALERLSNGHARPAALELRRA